MCLDTLKKNVDYICLDIADYRDSLNFPMRKIVEKILGIKLKDKMHPWIMVRAKDTKKFKKNQ